MLILRRPCLHLNWVGGHLPLAAMAAATLVAMEAVPLGMRRQRLYPRQHEAVRRAPFSASLQRSETAFASGKPLQG